MHLAFVGELNDKLIFSKKDLENSGVSLKEAHSTGLMRGDYFPSFNEPRDESSHDAFSFPHKTVLRRYFIPLLFFQQAIFLGP